MITITEAAKVLNLTDAAIYNGQYQDYIVRCEGTFNLFDIKKYQTKKDYEENYLSRAKLLLEYLVFEEEIGYRQIAELVGVSAQALHTHKFSFKVAVKLLKSLDDSTLDRFSKYYDFRSKWWR